MHRSVLSSIFLLAPFVFSFAFAMDVYIPVVPEMQGVFHTSQANIQLTLTLFLVVVGLGQLFMGPLSDQWGRRWILISNIVIFILGSSLCAATSTFMGLILGRLIQALGSCGMLVVSFAIVRDLYKDNEAAKIYSFLNCGLALSPLFAPIIGSYLGAWFGWRSTFIFLGILGILVGILALIRVKETLPLERRVKIDKGIFLRYFKILRNPSFIAFSAATTAGMALFFTFFSSSPYIVIKLLKAPMEYFGYYFFTVGLAFFIGSMISGKISDRYGPLKTAIAGAILLLFAGLLMLFWNEAAGLSAASYLIPCIIAGVAGSFMLGAGAGGAMQPFAETAGSAAAMLGCVQFLVGSAAGNYVMTWPMTSVMPLAISMACFGGFALVVLFVYTRHVKVFSTRQL